MPGAAAFLAALPRERWAIVTSAPRRLALRRLAAAGLPTPDLLVCAEDVETGNPSPEPYLKATAALGVEPSRCLVWEDAPAGIAAGHAAGAVVIAVAPREPVDVSPDLTIRDYRRLSAETRADGWLTLTIGS